MINNRFQQKGHITQTGNRASLNLKSLGSFKVAINKRNVDLQGEPAGDLITGDELSDGTVQVLPGWIWNFGSTILKGPKVGELVANGSKPSSFPPRESRGFRFDIVFSCGVKQPQRSQARPVVRPAANKIAVSIKRKIFV